VLAEAFRGDIHANSGPVYGVDERFPIAFQALSRIIREFIDGLSTVYLARN